MKAIAAAEMASTVATALLGRGIIVCQLSLSPLVPEYFLFPWCFGREEICFHSQSRCSLAFHESVRLALLTRLGLGSKIIKWKAKMMESNDVSVCVRRFVSVQSF